MAATAEFMQSPVYLELCKLPAGGAAAAKAGGAAAATGAVAPFCNRRRATASGPPGTPTKLRHNVISLIREEAEGRKKQIPPKHLITERRSNGLRFACFLFALWLRPTALASVLSL